VVADADDLLTIAAAGAIVWRGDPAAPDVALVHRPAYDDWSFPKGKVDPGEHVVAAAVREIGEEIGARVRLGVPLPTAAYTVRGVPKTVDYWVAEYVDGDFVPDEEVDAIAWLPLKKARQRLSHNADQGLLDVFATAPRATTASIAVRHAKAVSRAAWTDPDEGRPLTQRGERQSQVLAQILATAYEPARILTSPWLRCVQTVEPYAARISATVELVDLLGEDEFEDAPDEAVTHLASVVAHDPAVVVCSHGNVMPSVLAVLAAGEDRALQALAAAADRADKDPMTMAKGEFAVLHRERSGRVAGAERHRIRIA
jgi:8-oxo-dGTP diphosphatase